LRWGPPFVRFEAGLNPKDSSVKISIVNAELLVNPADGRARAVVLPLKEYRKLMRSLEDLEDALEIKKAKASAKSFISLDELTSRLKKKGLF
jgi:hypothetical protein